MKTKLLLLVVFIVACSNAEHVKPFKTDDTLTVDEQITKESVDTTHSAMDGASERDRYASFEAEYACILAQAAETEDPDAFNTALQRVESIAEEHGFTAEDVSRLTTQYKDDHNFKLLAQEKMMEKCPEVVEQAS